MVKSMLDGYGFEILLVGTIGYIMFAELFKDWFSTLPEVEQISLFILVVFIVLFAVSGDTE